MRSDPNFLDSGNVSIVDSNGHFFQVYMPPIMKLLVYVVYKQPNHGAKVIRLFGIPPSQVFQFQMVDSDPSLAWQAQVSLIYIMWDKYKALFSVKKDSYGIAIVWD